jgi:two-component system chemotaxis response regulator CheY
VAVEACSGRQNDALRILTDATPLFEASHDHALKGKFYIDRASVLTLLGNAEHRPDYTDRAILDYTAAAYHFEQAGHARYCARTENNLGFLFYKIGRYTEAREHLSRARRLFVGLNDHGSVAQVDETCARVLLSEGKPRVAARVIGAAVRALSNGGEQGVLAEALTTQGRVLARLNDSAGSQNKFREAADLAEQAGAVEDAGRALLALIEEHGEWLAERELAAAYERADGLLKETQDAETIARLRACARRFVAARRVAFPAAVKRSRADFWHNFSLPKQVQAYEARYIRRALLEAQGSVSRAARLLGFKHHASLVALLQRRHKSLAHLRTMPEKRKQSIIRLRGSRHTPDARVKLPLRVRAILHVEDNQLVADVVRDVFELEGWQVRTLVEGTQALSLLAGQAHFDLLLFDNDLPGVGGLELIREVRRLAHRRHVPIIMLSADDVKALAEQAGADVFLRKPEDIPMLCQTVRRLLDAAGDA